MTRRRRRPPNRQERPQQRRPGQFTREVLQVLLGRNDANVTYINDDGTPASGPVNFVRASGNTGFADRIVRDLTAESSDNTSRPGRSLMINDRQREAAAEKLEAEKAARFPLDWQSASSWVTSVYVNNNAVAVPVPIAEMSEELLYNTITWAVEYHFKLYLLYADDSWTLHVSKAPGLLAKEWLASRPAFRALLQEALRKSVAFNDAVYVYIKQHVVTYGSANGKQPLAASQQPWNNAAQLVKQRDLKAFLDQPVVVPASDVKRPYGNITRALDLGDT